MTGENNYATKNAKRTGDGKVCLLICISIAHDDGGDIKHILSECEPE